MLLANIIRKKKKYFQHVVSLINQRIVRDKILINIHGTIIFSLKLSANKCEANVIKLNQKLVLILA